MLKKNIQTQHQNKNNIKSSNNGRLKSARVKGTKKNKCSWQNNWEAITIYRIYKADLYPSKQIAFMMQKC